MNGMALVLISAAAVGEADVTYCRDVAPILWTQCAGCHRPGEVGPFSLLTYKDAARRASDLVAVTESRRMPPWKAEPGYGTFHDARRLSDADLTTIARWADAGAPEGDPADLPPKPKFPEGWQLGEPDLILTMAETVEIPADGRDLFRCFVIPMGLEEDRTVAAVEFRPGNRKVVHHALYFLDSSGAARKLDDADPRPGYESFGGIGFLPTGALGGWAPGTMPRRLPDDYGRRLPKGSDLVLQVHYHPSGKDESDRSSIGIYYTSRPASKILMAIPLVKRSFTIPAGEPKHEMTVDFTLPTDLHAVGITPHMHWIGREMKVDATLPDGTMIPLIWVKDWDFNWQGNYLYSEPVALPKGTRLHLVAHYDNTADNPRNPNRPPRDVKFGEQTTDEMCLCAIQVVPDARQGYLVLLQAIGRAFQGAGGGLPRRPGNPGGRGAP